MFAHELAQREEETDLDRNLIAKLIRLVRIELKQSLFDGGDPVNETRIDHSKETKNLDQSSGSLDQSVKSVDDSNFAAKITVNREESQEYNSPLLRHYSALHVNNLNGSPFVRRFLSFSSLSIFFFHYFYYYYHSVVFFSMEKSS